MAASTSSHDHTPEGDNSPAVSALMNMAEYFFSLTPQQVSEGVRCLLAALALHPPPRVEARARLLLGLALYHHSSSLLEAREHLNKAMLVAQSAANLEDIRFEAASVAAKILVEQNCLHQAKSLLRSKLEGSAHFPYWHIRLMLQLTDVHACERDSVAVVSSLTRCTDYAQQADAPNTRLLCMLYKGAYLLSQKNYSQAGEVLNTCSTLLEDQQGHAQDHTQSHTQLWALYLMIQVTHLLGAGQVKAAKPHLKQLQQCAKSLSNEPDATPLSNLTARSFEWLTKEQTFIAVYLVSVMHSVQAGYTEKALSYADKALQFIQQQKDTGVVVVLRAHLLEQIIQCLLMQGKSASAVEKLSEAVGVCHSHPQLVFSHRTVLHTLLGLYAFATDNLDRAVAQFHSALQHTNNADLRLFISLNLAVAYMKSGEDRREELPALMQAVESECAESKCQSLRAAVHYVRGLYSFCQTKLHEAKRHLRETLVLSNSSDLNKLTACSLILLGQIFLSLGNTKETMDMVSPAMQLASKIPDKNLQAWSASLLADLHHLSGDQLNEAAARETSDKALQELKSDQVQALQSSHNSLVQWTVGEWPVAKPVLRPRYESLPQVSSTGTPKHLAKAEAPHLHKDSKHTVSPVATPKKDRSRILNLHIDINSEEDLRLRDPIGSQSPIRKLAGTLDQKSTASLRDATNVKNSPAVGNITTPSKEMLDLASSRTLNGSPVLMKTPEVRLNRVSSPITTTPPRRVSHELQLGSSPALNGSQVPMKMPEVHLSRVDSPISTTPTRKNLLDNQRSSQERLKHTQSSQLVPSPEPQQQSMQTQPTPTSHSSVKEILQHTQSSPTKPTPAAHSSVKEILQQTQSSPRYAIHPEASPVQHLGTSPSSLNQLSPQDHRGSPFQQRTSPHQVSPNPQHQQPNRGSPGIQMPTLRHMSEQAPQQVYLQQLQQQQQQQHQQQQQQVARMQAQQQAMLQHYSPQKMHQSLGMSASEQQQQRQAQALLQQRALHQQQLMLQQAHAQQQQYLMQQARMGSQQQALFAHPPNVHAPSIQSYYAANPGMHPHVMHAAQSSKQIPQHQPHLSSHVNNLQRLSQEPSRSSLGPQSGIPHGHIAAPMVPMNPYSNPYAQSTQQFGSNIQATPGVPNPVAGRLNHYNPHGVMPGR